MAAAQSPLRRWKPYFPAFGTIDAAIVAFDPDGEQVGCAEVLREAMADVVELLCNDGISDDLAEEFCQILDDVMFEYLITLQAVPVTPAALASTDLAKAVGALQEHQSEKVRGLARDVVRVWRSSVESDIAKARATLEELRELSDDIPATPKIRDSVIVGRAGNCRRVPVVAAADDRDMKRRAEDAPSRTKTACVVRSDTAVPAKRVQRVSAPLLPKKSAPFAGRANTAANIIDDTKPPTPAAVGKGRGDHAPVAAADRERKRQAKEASSRTETARVVRGDTAVPAKREQKIPAPLLPKKCAPVVGAGRASTAATIIDDTKPPTTLKTPATVGNGRGDHAAGIDEELMESTKRKLREGYQEAADAKRRRKIQVIEAPKMPQQKQQAKMHPIMRERSRVRFVGTSTTAVRRSLMPAFRRS